VSQRLHSFGMSDSSRHTFRPARFMTSAISMRSSASQEQASLALQMGKHSRQVNGPAAGNYHVVPAINQRGRVPSRHVLVAENRDSHSNTFPEAPLRFNSRHFRLFCIPLSSPEPVGYYVRFQTIAPQAVRSRAEGGTMPQAPECWMCGELMELRIVRAPHPADDLHIFRCPYCHHVAKAILNAPRTARPRQINLPDRP
jgi:hypothetical protein